jgi:hypothetical protein
VKAFVQVVEAVIREDPHALVPVLNPFGETEAEQKERASIISFLRNLRRERTLPPMLEQYFSKSLDFIEKSESESWFHLDLLRSLYKQVTLVNILPLGSSERFIEEQKLAAEDLAKYCWPTDLEDIKQGFGVNHHDVSGLLPQSHLEGKAVSQAYEQFFTLPLRNAHILFKSELEKVELLKQQGDNNLDFQSFLRNSYASTTAMLAARFSDTHPFIVRRWGASGAKKPFERVHHQLVVKMEL